ncbi:MAG TPA: hypothetical protein VG164_01895 [Trebonia sp.]|nr:hypothetical protein [Trebonia sp.]
MTGARLGVVLVAAAGGGVRPAGTQVATDVAIDGRTYDVLDDQPSSGGNLVAYVLTSPVAAVRGLDVAGLVPDTVAAATRNLSGT